MTNSSSSTSDSLATLNSSDNDAVQLLLQLQTVNLTTTPTASSMIVPNNASSSSSGSAGQTIAVTRDEIKQRLEDTIRSYFPELSNSTASSVESLLDHDGTAIKQEYVDQHSYSSEILKLLQLVVVTARDLSRL